MDLAQHRQYLRDIWCASLGPAKGWPSRRYAGEERLAFGAGGSAAQAHGKYRPNSYFRCRDHAAARLGADPEILNFFYKNYSKTIPIIGKYVVGSSKPYDYLVKSIKEFYDQKQLLELLVKNGFSNVEYRNLSNGVSAIHSGWKI